MALTRFVSGSEETTTILGYSLNFLIQFLQTSAYLTSLHAVPQILKLNHVPGPFIVLVCYPFISRVDMRPEIGVALGDGAGER